MFIAMTTPSAANQALWERHETGFATPRLSSEKALAVATTTLASPSHHENIQEGGTAAFLAAFFAAAGLVRR